MMDGIDQRIKINALRALASIGARNYAVTEREAHDYYATDPKAVEMLLALEPFCKKVWEPACGEGHISKVLAERGFNVRSTDLIDRGYGEDQVDFLQSDAVWYGDIITNPPFNHASEFVRKAIETVTYGHKVAMFLKIQFLEGKERRKLFEQYPPRTVYVSTSRLRCAKNGDFEAVKNASAISFAWFVWEKGFNGETTLKWFN